MNHSSRGAMEDPEEECTVFKRREIRFLQIPASPRGALGSSKISMLLQSLELHRFVLDTPVPALDEELCTQFIKTFARKPKIDGGQGIVQGRAVVLCAHSIHRLTRLPLGDLSYSKPLAAPENASMLRDMFPSMKRQGQSYYLPRMSRRVDNLDEFIAIARMLTEKLLCQTDRHNYAEDELLLGMRFSLLAGVVMPWAVFLARRMVDAVVRSKERKSVFVFGQWLSGLIRSQLEGSPSDKRKRKESPSSKDEEDHDGVAARGSRIKQRRYVSGISTSDSSVEKGGLRKRGGDGRSEDSGSSLEKKRPVAMASITEEYQGATSTLSQPDLPPENEREELVNQALSPCKPTVPAKLEETPPENDKGDLLNVAAIRLPMVPGKLEEDELLNHAVIRLSPSKPDTPAVETSPENEKEKLLNQVAVPGKLEETPPENEKEELTVPEKLEETPPPPGQDQAAASKLPAVSQEAVEAAPSEKLKEADKDQAGVLSSTDVLEEARAVEIKQAGGGLLEETGIPKEGELVRKDSTDTVTVEMLQARKELLCKLSMLREDVWRVQEFEQEFEQEFVKVENRKLELTEREIELAAIDEELLQQRQEVDEERFAVALEESQSTPKESVRRLRDDYVAYKKMIKEMLQVCGPPS